ncbi:MAG: Uncharacterized protein LiPW30_455 [Parcubacteria group bacterium LiPW_30]|nr:MAG: Uncharacterized protein LiPW30_455 [Parcubacteria group bacterium LiPW_30]
MKYFAYGSNMLQGRLEDQKNVRDESIGSVQDIGTASLPDYRLVFNKIGKKDGISGKANIVQEQGAETLGVVYELSNEQINLLDSIEGKGYKRIPVGINFNGEQLEIDTYVAQANSVQEGLSPTREYLNFVIQGAVIHGFPEAYVSFLRSIKVQ